MDERTMKRREDEESLDIRKVFNIILSVKYWIMLSAIVCVGCAWLYLRYAQPTYQKSLSLLLVNDQDRYTNNIQLISSALGVGGYTHIDNEIYILRSMKLMRKVVEKGEYNIRYYGVGRVVTREVYDSSPVMLSFVPDAEHDQVAFSMNITLLDSLNYDINSLSINDAAVDLNRKRVAFGETVSTSYGKFIVSLRYKAEFDNGYEMVVTRSGTDKTAKEFCNALTVAATSKQTDVVTLTLTDTDPKRAENILDELAVTYNDMSKAYNGQNILNTIDFLNLRLDRLSTELSDVEGDFSNYRSANELLDVQSQSQMVMSSDMEYKDKLNDISLQINILDIIKSYVQDMDSSHKLIPTNVGLQDANLNTSIAQYNQLVIDRDKLLAGGDDNNPRVVNANKLLNNVRNNIMTSINNLNEAYNLQYKTTNRQIATTQRQITSLPSQQQKLTELNRAQQIKEPLYVLLQQKREEALIAYSSLADCSRIIDDADGSDTPSSPKRNVIYLLALMFGIVVPIGVVMIREMLRTYVVFEKDIADRTRIPILGIVPFVKHDDKFLSISENGRDPLTESFRMMRSKFDYLNINRAIDGAQVLQITSSGPGEGKSTISINIALSLAFLGKRVLVVGTDLRKPTLGTYVGIRSSKGLSTYLSGHVNDIHEIISAYPDCPMLDVIVGGPIPPNPAELLSTTRFSDAITALRKEYDYIILDTAPFLMVSDSLVVSMSADTVLYAVMAGKTKLATIDVLQGMYEQGTFKSIFIILNGVDFSGNGYYGHGYGYGKKYGYGYGYGYGKGYYGDDDGKRKDKKKRHGAV